MSKRLDRARRKVCTEANLRRVRWGEAGGEGRGEARRGRRGIKGRAIVEALNVEEVIVGVKGVVEGEKIAESFRISESRALG